VSVSDNHPRIDWCQISQMADGWIGTAISSIPGEFGEAEEVPKIPSGLQGFQMNWKTVSAPGI